MANEVWIVQGKNKVRLTTKRGIDVAEDVNDSIRVTLQHQIEEIIGKIILSDPDGKALPLIETLTSGLTIANAVAVRTKTVACPSDPIEIPGIGSGVAYADGDCFGTLFSIKVPKSGKLVGATLWDMDDKAVQVDLEIFRGPIVQIADNTAWSPTDATMKQFLTEMQFYAFDDHINSQTSEIKSFGKDYVCPLGVFVIQAVIRGAPTSSTGVWPMVQLYILSDDPDFEP